MRSLLKRCGLDEAGGTAIEYSLIAALIGLAIITVAQSVGFEVSGVFVEVENGLKSRKGA
jgi:pilus assembly protein Flp/PilA